MDILLTQPEVPAHRAIGSDDDGVVRMCPAFAPDGTRLAFGEGVGDDETGWDAGALVIADVTADGTASVVDSIGVDPLMPPCPIWSPDGRSIAFGAATHDTRRRAGVPEIWILDVQTKGMRRLTGLAAIDIEWAPDGSQLYITDKAGIVVYSLADGQSRTLADTEFAETLTVSPDGLTLAVERRRFNSAERYDLLLMDADGSDQRILVPDYIQMHGLGPVWSPDGSRVVFQRSCMTFTDASGNAHQCSEQHDVVVVAVGDDDPAAPAGTQTVVPVPVTSDGDETRMWWPYSVTWSPDSTNLLYLGWGESWASPEEPTYVDGLLAVPLAGSSTPAVLYQATDWIAAYPGLVMNNFQSWGAE